jgi:hypothetical protein
LNLVKIAAFILIGRGEEWKYLAFQAQLLRHFDLNVAPHLQCPWHSGRLIAALRHFMIM